MYKNVNNPKRVSPYDLESISRMEYNRPTFNVFYRDTPKNEDSNEKTDRKSSCGEKKTNNKK